jgi:N-carbamoylputrescine amidase
MMTGASDVADRLRIALITEVFHDDPEGRRLDARLAEAKTGGAELAVLPELPLDPWAPASREPSEDDAELPDGPRQRRQAAAARKADIAVLGGAIIRDPVSGRRHNTVILFDASGQAVASYRKLHLPEETGFWETHHYEPGTETPAVIRALPLSIGIQICSDVNRPEGSHQLAALGAEAIFAPRATPRDSYARWRLVLRANAITSGLYVVSVNRTGPERGVPIGGPSLVVAPDGSIVLETEDPVGLATLERSAVAEARREYPGYLPVRADLYAAGWAQAAKETS